jgi:glucosyl-dolichyl phosphate glucuronosyltransferase
MGEPGSNTSSISGGIMTGITVAIATYNRAGELARTLQSFQQIEIPSDISVELIVIANRCTDETETIVAKAAVNFPVPLRVVREDRQGLSHARNRAILAAKYDVVAFLDDDVDVDKNWLKAMAAAHASREFAAIGGKAPLVYPAGRPQWLNDTDEGLLSKVDHGDQRRPAAADELYGVNVSFQRRAVMEAGGFRPDLGRVGNNLIGDEEFELLTRIIAAGGKLLYEPAALVGHRVPTSRLSRRWFWRRCFHGNRGAVRALSADEVNAGELARTGYRAMLAAKNSLAKVRHPRGEAFFHETVVLASRLGRFFGLLSRMLGHTTEIDQSGSAAIVFPQPTTSSN